MPVTYQIDESRGIIRIKADGDVTFEEELAVGRKILNDSRWRPGIKVLFDSRTRTPGESEAGPRMMVDFILKERKKIGQTRFAVLISSITSFKLTSLVSILLEKAGIEMNVFYDEASAEAWLLNLR